MLKKINLIIAIAAVITLSGCDKKAAKQQAEMNPKYHNLPVDVQADLQSQVDASGFDASNSINGSMQQLSESQSQETLDQLETANETGEANATIFREAKEALGESSAAGPDGGNLACAWMVNKILERSVGFKVDGDSTSRMDTEFQALVSSGKAEKIDVADSRPGDIILSPTGAKVGHVGIIGESNEVYSNSSSAAEWKQNFTVDRWTSYYQGSRNLPVNIYRIVS
ncbi:MAG: hypothetical protein KC646_16605 [Candidatus Cloacimonetes bacterium]|nr:hypothetical protein [Candidatus Cloacimonadota bacterium]